MKNISTFFLLGLFWGCSNVFAQDRAIVPKIKALSLDSYLEEPAYIINKNYAVYECGKTRKIIYADIPSFKRINYYGSGIALDKNGVYFQGTLLKIDTTGFEVVGNTGEHPVPKILFWKNKDKVYENAVELSRVDVKSFGPLQCINGPYFKDKHHIYYFDKKIVNSDPATVNSSCGDICYDKNNIYIQGKIAYSDKGEKLLPVNEKLIKTTKTVFYFANNRLESTKRNPLPSKVIAPTMDAATLKGLSRNYSIDKYHVYYDTTALPIKPENFKNIKVWDQVNSAYISDGIHVYARNNFEPGFDAPSFGMFPE